MDNVYGKFPRYVAHYDFYLQIPWESHIQTYGVSRSASEQHTNVFRTNFFLETKVKVKAVTFDLHTRGIHVSLQHNGGGGTTFNCFHKHRTVTLKSLQSWLEKDCTKALMEGSFAGKVRLLT